MIVIKVIVGVLFVALLLTALAIMVAFMVEWSIRDHKNRKRNV